jgi:hypothetical protein
LPFLAPRYVSDENNNTTNTPNTSKIKKKLYILADKYNNGDSKKNMDKEYRYSNDSVIL